MTRKQNTTLDGGLACMYGVERGRGRSSFRVVCYSLCPMVLCSGCFDGLHAGHVRYLEAAQRLQDGELVMVAVAPDVYIHQVKGREPHWSASDRQVAVEALRCVRSAIISDLAPAVLWLWPKLVVKGSDWRGRLPAAVLDACAAVGAEIVFVDSPGRHVSEAGL